MLEQDTLVSLGPSALVTFQEMAPPLGLLEVTMLVPPKAIQRPGLGHDTPLRPLTPTLVTFQAGDPAPGLLDVTTLAGLRESTATQSWLLIQDTLVRPPYWLNGSTVVGCQAVAPPLGLVEVTTLGPPRQRRV